MSVAELLWAIVAAGGGGALVTLTLLKVFGEKWLDSKFAGRLQDLRHEHERQMETVRLDSSRVLDRSTRLSEREFEATAEIWSLVFDAYVRTMGALPGFRQHDDFSRLSDELAEVVGRANEFEDWEIRELLSRAKTDRNSYYNDRKRVHEMRDARMAVRDASNALARKALFLERNVHQQLTVFVDQAWKALVARNIILEAGPGSLDGVTRDDEEFRANAESRIQELENVVRARFWGPSTPPRLDEPTHSLSAR